MRKSVTHRVHKRRSHRRKTGTRSHRVKRRSHGSSLRDKTVEELRRMASRAGVHYHKHGHALKKTSLIHALSGRSHVRRSHRVRRRSHRVRRHRRA